MASWHAVRNVQVFYNVLESHQLRQEIQAACQLSAQYSSNMLISRINILATCQLAVIVL
jgi:hypothetical protein